MYSCNVVGMMDGGGFGARGGRYDSLRRHARWVMLIGVAVHDFNVEVKAAVVVTGGMGNLMGIIIDNVVATCGVVFRCDGRVVIPFFAGW